MKKGDWLLLVLLPFSVAQCGKRPPPLPPPSEPPSPSISRPADVPPDRGIPAPPELELRVEPAVIQRGESALLTWRSRNASEVRIDPNIGPVDPSGRIKFFPEETTIYTVTATGPGGAVSDSATIEVRLNRRSKISSEDLRNLSLKEQFQIFVKPVFFEFDSAVLTEEAQLTLDGNVRWLSRPENLRITLLLEGHTDERGSEEYNLALGDKRAQVVREFLVNHGIDVSRIDTISMGEERPFDTRKTEEGYALNRRAQFVFAASR